MEPIQFLPEISDLIPVMRLGVLSAKVTVTPPQDNFWEMAAVALQPLHQLSAQEIKEIPALKAARQAYKKCGHDPSRYRLSAESLLRRLMKSQSLYRVSNVVDLVNYLSITTGLSMGAYDQEQIIGDIYLRQGQVADDYQAIGRGRLNIDQMPVLVDQQGAFGNPSSDSMRTAVQSKTQSILLVIYDFGAQSICSETLLFARQLLSNYAQGHSFQDDLFTAS